MPEPVFNTDIDHGAVVLPTTSFQTDFIPDQGSTPLPAPFDFKPEHTSPVLDVLRYEAGRLLALTAPRLWHGDSLVNTNAYQPPPPNTNTVVTNTPPALQPEQIDVNGDLFKHQSAPGDLVSYKTLAYGQIQDRVSRNAFTSTSPIINTGHVGARGVSDVNLDDDFVDLFMSNNKQTIRFRAYITSFVDSIQVEWNPINYVGRQDTLRAFKGSTRAVSLSFKTAAFTKADLKAMYNKLNSFITMVAVAKPSPAVEYLSSPLCKLTVGNWFYDTPCIVNTIKFDTQPTEYSWDVGEPRERGSDVDPGPEGSDLVVSDQMPMIVDISLDLIILGDVQGNLLGSTNKYFGFADSNSDE